MPGSNNPAPAPTVHEDMLMDIFNIFLSRPDFLQVRGGSNLIDHDYQSRGDEYRHGLYVYGDNITQSIAQTKMRDNFIYKMGGFVRNRDMASFGEGLHSILDTYVEIQTRVNMLNYYTYDNKLNVVHGMNASPYIHNPVPCTEAAQFIYDALKALPSTASDTEVGAVFDQWVSMVQGGAGKPDLWN